MFQLIQYYHLAANLSPLHENGSLLTNSVLKDALLVMGVGFGSVFVVLSIIYLICQLLNRMFPGQREEG